MITCSKTDKTRHAALPSPSPKGLPGTGRGTKKYIPITAIPSLAESPGGAAVAGGGRRRFISPLLARRSPLLSRDRRPRVRPAHRELEFSVLAPAQDALRVCGIDTTGTDTGIDTDSDTDNSSGRAERCSAVFAAVLGVGLGRFCFARAGFAAGCGLGNLPAPVQTFRVALAKNSGMGNAEGTLLQCPVAAVCYFHENIIYLVC